MSQAPASPESRPEAVARHFPGLRFGAVGLGLAYVNVSDDVATAEAIGGATVLSDYEIAVELVYDLALTPAMSLQPSLQWIRHPGGSKALKDAWVFGLRANVSF